MKTSLSLFVLFGAMLRAHAQAPDPRPVIEQFDQIRHQASLDVKAGKKVSRDDINAALAATAKVAVVGVDITKIKPEDASSWADIFGLAGDLKDSGELASKAASYYTFKAWMAQQQAIESLVDQGKADEVVNFVRFAIASEVRMLAQMGDQVHGSITAKFGKTRPDVVLACYDSLLNRLDPKGLIAPIDKKWGDICFTAVSADRYDFLFRIGRKTEALAGLHALKARFAKSLSANAYGNKPLDVIDQTLNAWGTMRVPAPKLAFQKTIGSFPGLEQSRGKVVLLDFFAHWCGPCKKAFPEMRQIYAKYKPQGLEMVGMTTFYGYYELEKGISKSQEFDKMKGFVKQFDMTWPVAFDATKSDEKSFNVSTVPHLAIIDRKGLIRMVTVGYDPSDRERIEAFIQKLLAEK